MLSTCSPNCWRTTCAMLSRLAVLERDIIELTPSSLPLPDPALSCSHAIGLALPVPMLGLAPPLRMSPYPPAAPLRDALPTVAGKACSSRGSRSREAARWLAAPWPGAAGCTIACFIWLRYAVWRMWNSPISKTLRTMYISRCCRSLTTTRHTREKGGPTRRGPTSTLELIERTSLPSISRITSPTLSLPESCAAAPLCNRRTCSPPPSTRAMSMPSPTFASESLSGKGMVGWRRSVTVSSRH
mmetsp:Transcript_5651/g.13613  ORF Transcript_5651/g.13613 Transcript_5651/m.13613 type:complete len:243 (+) Transcript_5651:673-1401(+)